MLSQNSLPSSRVKKTIFVIILLSVTVRLFLGIAMKDSFYDRGNRYSIINPIAHNIIQHKEFSIVKGIPTADHEPLYVMFVAIAYSAIDHEWLGLLLLQILLSIINGLLVFLITDTLFKDKRAALIALAFYSFYPYYITQTITVVDTTLFNCLLALSVSVSIFSVNRQSAKFGLLSGFTWGLTLLTRFSAIALVFWVIVYYFWNFSFKRAVIVSALFIIGSVIMLSPWMYRNYQLTEQWFISTHGAIEIWLGYNERTEYILRNNISVDTMKKNITEKIPVMKEVHNNTAPFSIERALQESKVFIGQSIEFLVENTWHCIRIMPLKFAKFWSWQLNPTFHSKNKTYEKWWPRLYTLSYLPILISGLVGVYWARGNIQKHSIFIFMFLGYTILHTVIYGFSRLRLPIDQFLMIYAAYAVIYLFQQITRRQHDSLAIG